MSRKNYILLSGLAVLIVAAIIGSGVGAQVLNQFNQNGTNAWSPSGLRQKPDDLKELPKGVGSQRDDLLSQDVPEDIVYGQVFRHLEELNKKADEEEQKGNNGNKLRNLYKQMARLDDRQARALDKIVRGANQELKKLDHRAKQIIAEGRSRTPGRRLERGQAPPPPPAELSELSQRRKEVIWRAVGELRAEFGEGEFARFADFVERKVKPGIKKRGEKVH